MRRVVLAVVALTSLAGASLSAQDTRSVFEASPVVMLANDQDTDQGSPYSASGTLFGGRGAIRLGPLYVTGRYLSGTTGAVGDSLPSRNLTVWNIGGGLFLAGTFRIDAESWLRGAASTLSDQRFGGWSIGLGFDGDLVPDVVTARFLAHYSPSLSTSQPPETASLAWDGSVEIGVKPRTLPLRLWLGYELQRLDFSSGRRGRFSGITFGLGVQL